MIHIENKTPVEGALRAKLDSAWPAVLARADVGFPSIPTNDEIWKSVEARLREVRPARRIAVIGIGGSSLGLQVINQSLRRPGSPEIYFLESPDPSTWASLAGFQAPEWKDRHLIIISKSGGTLETLSWVERIAADDAGWLANSQVTVIASPGQGALQTWAKNEGVASLTIPSNIGGRFSVMTPVGLFPAGLMGADLNGFREGARWAVQHPELATELSAAILQSWSRGAWITQSWIYAERLRLFGEWWQQLWGESLGKKKTRAGGEAPRVSTPMACAGPRDQHSLVQQLMEGARDKFVIVTRVDSVERDSDSFTARVFPKTQIAGQTVSLGRVLAGEADAFQNSLAESGIGYLTIRVKDVSESSLGALFMLWQMTIAQLGEVLGIDAFDQPGVELGKKMFRL